MKNLLKDAMKELVIRVNGEMKEIKNAIRIEETKGMKLNILNERRNTIINLFEKLEYLKEQFEIRFPEEELDMNIERFKLITKIQLEDMLDIINEAGILEIE